MHTRLSPSEKEQEIWAALPTILTFLPTDLGISPGEKETAWQAGLAYIREGTGSHCGPLKDALLREAIVERNERSTAEELMRLTSSPGTHANNVNLLVLMSKKHASVEWIQFLESYHSDLHTVNKDEKSAFEIAMDANHLDCAAYLLQRDPDFFYPRLQPYLDRLKKGLYWYKKNDKPIEDKRVIFIKKCLIQCTPANATVLPNSHVVLETNGAMPTSTTQPDLLAKIKEGLDSYIQKIETTYKSDFQHGFHFFKKSQAENRKANYYLALDLQAQLKKGIAIETLFSSKKGLRERRSKLMQGEFAFHDHGMHSHDLNKVLHAGLRLTTATIKNHEKNNTTTVEENPKPNITPL